MLLRVGSAEVGGLIEVVEFARDADLAWTSITGIDQRGRWRLRPANDGRTTVTTLRLSYGVAGSGIWGWLADHVSAPDRARPPAPLAAAAQAPGRARAAARGGRGAPPLAHGRRLAEPEEQRLAVVLVDAVVVGGQVQLARRRVTPTPSSLSGTVMLRASRSPRTSRNRAFRTASSGCPCSRHVTAGSRRSTPEQALDPGLARDPVVALDDQHAATVGQQRDLRQADHAAGGRLGGVERIARERPAVLLDLVAGDLDEALGVVGPLALDDRVDGLVALGRRCR